MILSAKNEPLAGIRTLWWSHNHHEGFSLLITIVIKQIYSQRLLLLASYLCFPQRAAHRNHGGRVFLVSEKVCSVWGGVADAAAGAAGMLRLENLNVSRFMGRHKPFKKEADCRQFIGGELQTEGSFDLLPVVWFGAGGKTAGLCCKHCMVGGLALHRKNRTKELWMWEVTWFASLGTGGSREDIWDAVGGLAPDIGGCTEFCTAM